MDELIDFVERLMAYIQQNGASLNQETQQALAQFLRQAFEIIETAGQQATEPAAQPTQNPAPPPPAGMPSSNVAGMKYDNKTHNLMVQFLGKYPNRQGSVYQYPNVPPQIAELLQSGAIPARTNGQNKWGKWWKGKVPSAGASVFTLLKNRGAPFQKIS